MTESTVAVRFRVRGRVQGVGFRWFVQSTAESLGLMGFVQNEPDGTVTGAAKASSFHELQRFETALRSGPEHAKVTGVEVEPLDLRDPSSAREFGACDGFLIRRC